MTNQTDARTKAAVNLANTIGPLLAGKGAQVQGATLALLLATYLRGHKPSVRNKVFNSLLEATLRLVDTMEEEP